jgi:proline dehydrogenase
MERSRAVNDIGPTGHFSTIPPDVSVPGFRRRIGEALSTAIMPLIKRAARPFLGGETIDDALCVSARLRGEGFATALSYWDGGSESLSEMEAVSLVAIAAMAPTACESYLSVKPPALQFSLQTGRLLASAAATHGLRIHFDSHGVEVTDLQKTMMEAMLATLRPECLGTTLPGRQQRSLLDAEWAIEKKVNVRVVKGAWPDPANPKYDPRDGFLDVIDRLAGRAHHVAVATHDLALSREAITRLKAAGTSCEIEVLLGMPVQTLLRWAKVNGVKVRVYVPYGCGFIPNAAGVLRRNPRLALAIAQAQFSQCLAAFSSRR